MGTLRGDGWQVTDTDGAFHTLDLIPRPEQEVSVSGEIVDPSEGRAVPCVMVRMAGWRATGLATVLDRWTEVHSLVSEDGAWDESALAAMLREAAEEAKAADAGRE
jgi:hypothetical protein